MESSCGGELLLLDDRSGEPGGERAGPSGERERDRAGLSGERAGPSGDRAGPSGDLGGTSVTSFSLSSLPLAKPFSSSS